MSGLIEECDSLVLELQNSYHSDEGGDRHHNHWHSKDERGYGSEGEGKEGSGEWYKEEADLSALDLDVAGFSQD